MRTIPVPNRNPVGNTGPATVAKTPLVSNLRMDEGAMNAPNRTLVGAGNAIAGAGELMGRFAMEKADQRNKGILANEETVRMETAAKIQAFMEANPNDPDSWGVASNTTWEAYEKGRSERAKKEKWAPAVVEKDTLQYQLYRSDFGIRARAEQDKAYVRQSNARLEANAEAKLRAGDYDGFVKSMDEMNLFADVKERKIRAGLEEGTYRIAGTQLDALRDLPPSKAIPAIQAFIAAVNEKDAKGKFKEYEFERGGMSIGARQQLVTVAQGRIREQERAMAVNGRAIIADIRMGRADVTNLFDAVKAGELTPDVAKAIMPEVAQAVDEWDAKLTARADAKAAKEEAAKRRLQEQAQQQNAAAERLRSAALERGKVGIRDIERQLALGEITPTQAEQLKEELIQASRAEVQMEKGDYAMIAEKIRGGLSAKMFGRQPSDVEYQRIQADITGSKHLTKETRLKLMDELFTLKLADISDLQEEGPENGRWADRDITPQERALRRDLLGSYKKLLPALGDVTAGDLMFSQEARIRAFFDTAKTPRAQAEIEKFTKEQLLPEIQKAAGFEALKDAFKF
jgi:hypothetical protein